MTGCGSLARHPGYLALRCQKVSEHQEKKLGAARDEIGFRPR